MALSFKTCKYCGRIFQSSGSNECPECLRKMEEQFKMIKEFLYQNHGASVEEVAQGTGVDERLVLHFLREGRLEMVSADGSLLCEKCGEPITSGRLCKKCANTLSQALGSVLPAGKQPDQTSEQKAQTPRQSRADRLHVNVSNRK